MKSGKSLDHLSKTRTLEGDASGFLARTLRHEIYLAAGMLEEKKKNRRKFSSSLSFRYCRSYMNDTQDF